MPNRPGIAERGRANCATKWYTTSGAFEITHGGCKTALRTMAKCSPTTAKRPDWDGLSHVRCRATYCQRMHPWSGFGRLIDQKLQGRANIG